MVYFFYLEQFPLIQAAVNVIYSSSCPGHPGSSLRTPGGGRDPALGPPDQVVVYQGLEQRFMLLKLHDLQCFPRREK